MPFLESRGDKFEEFRAVTFQPMLTVCGLQYLEVDVSDWEKSDGIFPVPGAERTLSSMTWFGSRKLSASGFVQAPRFAARTCKSKATRAVFGTITSLHELHLISHASLCLFCLARQERPSKTAFSSPFGQIKVTMIAVSMEDGRRLFRRGMGYFR